MIYSTIAEKIFVQMNDSLEAPVFKQVDRDSVEDFLSRDDWEPWDELRPN